MTTVAAEKTAAHSGEQDNEKVEKRRALGRGLESLLSGPRMVARPATTPAAAAGATSSDLPKPVPGVVEMIQAVADEPLPSPNAAADGVGAIPRQGPKEGITILAQAESRTPGSLVVNLAIADIDKNPFQTRFGESDDALAELTNSIKANGVIQPIVVRPAEEKGRYILILGERRLHASKVAGKTTIPAIVRRVSGQQAAEMTIIENLQREDLSPLEQAEAFRVLSEEFKLTQAQIGERVGLSRESVANYMRLLKLPGRVILLLRDKKLNFAHAKELLKLDGEDHIVRAAYAAVEKGMTVEQLERYVLHLNGLDTIAGQEQKKGAARWVDPNVRAAQMELQRLLGVRVKIRDRKGKGKIIIEYSTVDDYDRVVGMLKGKQ
jgi:ParB family chromosome partitioning protein